MRKYGSDKPDLRNPIEMQDVTEHFRGSGFKVFAGMIDEGPEGARLGHPRARPAARRAFCDRMNAWAQGEGQPGLGYIFWREEGEAGCRARSPRTSAPERTEAICAASSAWRTATPCSSSPATRRSSTSSPASARDQGRRTS